MPSKLKILSIFGILLIAFLSFECTTKKPSGKLQKLKGSSKSRGSSKPRGKKKRKKTPTKKEIETILSEGMPEYDPNFSSEKVDVDKDELRRFWDGQIAKYKNRPESDQDKYFEALNKRDYEKLYGSTWLSTTILDKYSQFLRKRVEDSKCVLYPSALWETYIAPLASYQLRNSEKVEVTDEDVTTKVKIEDFKKWFAARPVLQRQKSKLYDTGCAALPMFEEEHWILAVLDHRGINEVLKANGTTGPQNSKKAAVGIIDSFHTQQEGSHQGHLTKGKVMQEFFRKVDHSTPISKGTFKLITNLSESSRMAEASEVVQIEASNCGVFVAMYMRMLMFYGKIMPHFADKRVARGLLKQSDHFRVHMLAEFFYGQILPPDPRFFSKDYDIGGQGYSLPEGWDA